MFGFCHRHHNGCQEAACCADGSAGLFSSERGFSLRLMKEGQKARILHVQASGELGRRIRDMGLVPGAEVDPVDRGAGAPQVLRQLAKKRRS